jgi:hypothetical protein
VAGLRDEEVEQGETQQEEEASEAVDAAEEPEEGRLGGERGREERWVLRGGLESVKGRGFDQRGVGLGQKGTLVGYGLRNWRLI